MTSEASDPRPSSLDPELLRILEAAQAGIDSPLLDDAPILLSDTFTDGAPQNAAPAGNQPVLAESDPATPGGDSEVQPVELTEDFVSAPAASSVESHGEDWFVDEPPLTQSMLDAMVADEDRRRELMRLDAPEAPQTDERPGGDSWDAAGTPEIRFRPPGSPPVQIGQPPMSQEELDLMILAQTEAEAPTALHSSSEELSAAEAASSSASESHDDAPMSQADLDALLAGEAGSAPDPEPEDDAPLSQADLDALLAVETAAAHTSEPDDDGPMSQAELDALLAGEAAPAPAPEPDEDGPMSQAELDALLAGEAAPAPAPEPDDEGPMSQAELDALLAGEAAPAPAPEPDDEGPMSQAELDALLAGEAAPAPAPEPDEDGPMSQAELDALLAGEAAPAPAPEPDEDTPLSQADLDALLALEAPADAKTGDDLDRGLSQEALDALMAVEIPPQSDADFDADSPLAQADLDAMMAAHELPATPAAPQPTTSSGLLSQADLDALLADEAASSRPDKTLSQSDLDALLASAAGQDSKTHAAPADRPLTLSQDDLDALLAGAGAPPQEERRALSLSKDDINGLLDDNAALPMQSLPDAPLDQSSIDALLAGAGDDQVLDGSRLDAPVDQDGLPIDDDISLSQSSIDSLMADLDRSGVLAASTAARAAGPGVENQDDDEIDGISQDMIDSLIANAQAQAGGAASPATTSEVGSENFAAAANVQDGGPELLSQSDLDRLIEESKVQDKQRNSAKQRALEDAINAAQSAARGEASPAPVKSEARARRFQKPILLTPFVRENAARIAACLLMGGLTSIITGLLLHANRESAGAARPQTGIELQVALERAGDEMDRGDYTAAIAELEDPVAAAPPGALRDDAMYVLLEARYRSFRGKWGSAAFDDLTAQIDQAIDQAPAHPRAPEALYWKALLFSEDMPLEALEIYERLFAQYSEAPGMDKMLMDATTLALAQRNPLPATIYAQDLLRRFPGSRWAGQAILAIADANVLAGNEQDARTTYVRIAEAEPDTGLGAQAFLRLGKLAYDTGQYKQAIAQLTRRLETTTTTEGNDEVYLLLGRAYRRDGQLNAARDTLNDLLNIFEPGPVTPQAYIEYSQVLEALGEREKAVKTAQRAALEYPENPDVLRNSGEFLGLDGNALAAASAFVAADEAGAADPNLLLNAARYYRAALLPDEAAKTYERVKVKYGGSPAALLGGIEAAQLRNEQGDAEAALDDLKTLQATTRKTEFYLPTLSAMQEIYKDLGLTEHIQTTAREIIQNSEDPEVLAAAAMDLMNAGDLESAQNAIDRIDLALLKQPTAFNLLMKEGASLLTVAPERGLEKMEQAHFGYPEARTREADQTLLRTYLLTGRPAAARRMVMELKATAEENHTEIPYLVDAAIAWGDYLYENEDYRTAEFAYALAEDAGKITGGPVAGLRSHPDWARYQRANALLRLADYQGCLTLYDEISASDSPWAGEAAVKANLARLEQRQRGITPPPSPLAQAG